MQASLAVLRNQAISHKAVVAAKAKGKSITGHCAKYVHAALTAGGINLIAPAPTVSPWPSAKDYGPSLQVAGFAMTLVLVPKTGDIVVIQPYKGHKPPDGHIAMYDGKVWISDFVQGTEIWPGPGYRAAKPPHVYYRYPDQE